MNKNLSILLIEDDLQDAVLLEEQLSHITGYDFNVTNTRRIKDSIEYLNENVPDIILIDLGLPDSQGRDTFKLIQPFSKYIPVVVLTGLNDDDLGKYAITKGAQDYLVKNEINTSLIKRAIIYAIERKKAELALIESNVTRDKLFSIISHDLRGPISGIRNVLEMLGENISDITPGYIERTIPELKKSADRVYDLLNNLLMWSKTQRKKLRINQSKTDLMAMINENIELFKTMATNKHINIISNLQQPLFVWVDKLTILTTFRNLFSNAIKFTPPDGEISISVKTNTDKTVSVFIKDNGMGMSSDAINKILSPNDFYSSFGTEGEPGSGLGLKLCNEFIEANMGYMNIFSEPGKGTTIQVNLIKYNEQ